jgi:Holliday junction resolvasome RuvABC ATP-dependent DNA helicase subunit
MEITIRISPEIEEILRKRVENYNANILPTLDSNAQAVDIELEAQMILERAVKKLAKKDPLMFDF